MFSSAKMHACFPPRFPRKNATLFAFDPESIDWWDYWINIHIPALRRWCYPLMEGRPLEARAPRELDWSAQVALRQRRYASVLCQRRADPDHFMAIFVTGSTGYLGSYVVAGLLQDYRDSLNLLVRASSKQEARERACGSPCSFISISRNFSIASIRGCASSAATLPPSASACPRNDYHVLVDTTDSIIHCAASLNRKSERQCLNVNLRGSLEVIQLARRIVHDRSTGSGAIPTFPRSPLLATVATKS